MFTKLQEHHSVLPTHTKRFLEQYLDHLASTTPGFIDPAKDASHGGPKQRTSTKRDPFAYEFIKRKRHETSKQRFGCCKKRNPQQANVSPILKMTHWFSSAWFNLKGVAVPEGPYAIQRVCKGLDVHHFDFNQRFQQHRSVNFLTKQRLLNSLYYGSQKCICIDVVISVISTLKTNMRAK